MTETGETVSPSAPDSATPDAALQTPGALLRQERTRRGLSVQQSAEGLHLDVWIIEAIEANHFLALGAPVYAKGYLRKYATMLGLAPDVIVARYETLTDTPVVPTPIPVITTTPPPRPKWPKYVGWGALAAMVIAIAVVAYEFLMPAQAPIEVAPTQASAVEVAPAAVPMPVNEPPANEPPRSRAESAAEPPRVTVPTTQPVVAETPKRAESPVRAEPAPANAIADTGTPVRLRLEFTEPSWVEVYDANGQRLVYDIGQPSRPRIVSGAAPLNVVVGVADAVSVQVNDQTIVVPRQANRDSTRFRVAADGSVR